MSDELERIDKISRPDLFCNPPINVNRTPLVKLQCLINGVRFW